MVAIEVCKNDFLNYDEYGCGWYRTEHERQFSDAICDISLVKEKWNYCPGCGRNIAWIEVKK